MKKVNSFNSMILGIAFAMLGANLSAQPGNGNGYRCNPGPGDGKAFCATIPGLTSEQEKQIDDMRTAHLKEMNALKNDLLIKRAELQKLETADKPDMGQINKKIDEMGIVKTEMAKKRAAHIQQIRGLLAEEQKVYFDTHHQGRGFGQCCKHYRGQGGQQAGMRHDCPMNR